MSGPLFRPVTGSRSSVKVTEKRKAIVAIFAKTVPNSESWWFAQSSVDSCPRVAQVQRLLV
jgi:hypothetical protein